MASHDALERYNEYQAKTPDLDDSVIGASPDDTGDVTTTGDAEQMLARMKRNGHQAETETMRKRVKSQRYGDVPYYTLESLDMDTLREEVFDALDFTESEKQAAGALINNPGETYSRVAEISGLSNSTVGRVARVLEGSQNPTESQEEILRYARENPDASMQDIANALDRAATDVRVYIRAYRHSRVEVDIPVRVCAECGDELDDGEAEFNDEDEVICEDCASPDEEPEHDERDAVEKDLSGEDVSYKYDTKSPTGVARPETPAGRRLDTIQDKDHLMAVIQEFNSRVSELESQVQSSELKGRLVALENRLDGLQSVVDRIEDQQANVERYVEDNMVDNDQYGSTVSGLKRLSNDQDELSDRLDRIEESLKSHKEAIEDVRDGYEGVEVTEGASFSGEEKKDIIVALVENGQSDLIEKVIDDL